MGTALEEAVKRPEQPAKQRINDPRQPVFRRVMIFQQHRRQRRRERQRVNGRDHCRDGDGSGELLVELPGDAREKRHRYKHRAQHQRNGDDRPGDLTHRLMCGGARRQPHLNVTFDVLHHHNGVIHHDTNRQHQPEQAQRIQREAKQIEHAKGTDY